MRILATLLGLLLAALAAADPAVALILIRPERAGPPVHTSAYIHAEWIAWPVSTSGGINRVESLLSGVDWVGETADLSSVVWSGAGAFLSNYDSLEARGYVKACERQLGQYRVSLIGSLENFGLDADFLGGLSGRVFPNLLKDRGSANAFDISEATNWNDVVAFAKDYPGRILVVEYPVPAGQNLSRYWTFGKGWPERRLPIFSETGLPGMVPARRVADWLIHPQTATWTQNNAGEWGGANRWRERAQSTGPVVLVIWAMGAVYVLLCGLYATVTERRGTLAVRLTQLLLLAPAALLLEGRFARAAGIDATLYTVAGAWLALALLALILNLMFKGDESPTRGLASLGLAGLIGSLLGSPIWCLLNEGGPETLTSISRWIPAIFALYLGLTTCFARGQISIWGSRAILLVAIGYEALLFVRGEGEPSRLAVPFLLFVLVETKVPDWTIPILIFFPPSIVALVRHGATITHDGLSRTLAEASAVRMDTTLGALTSTTFLGSLVLVAVAAFAGGKFLFWRTTRATRRNHGTRAMLQITGAAFALGVLDPFILPTAFTFAAGSVALLTIEVLRDP